MPYIMPAAVFPIAGDPYGSGMRAPPPVAAGPDPSTADESPISADPDVIRAGCDANYFGLFGRRCFINGDLPGDRSRIGAHDAAGHGG